MKNNKSLGQHWLKNRVILDEIADLAALGGSLGAEASASEIAGTGVENDGGVDEIADNRGDAKICIEIGPGLGTLTSSLLKRFERVIAVEYDARLAENLPKSFPGANLEVVKGDILDVDFAELTSGEKYVIAGNIPYYITSPILEKVLTEDVLAERVVLLMQKEVAERILSEKETVLSLFVKNRALVEAGPVVPRDEFTPPPKVDSQVLVLEPHGPEVSEEVFKLIKRAFKSPRKKLRHTIPDVPEEYVDLRPGDLHLQDYKKLSQN